MKLYEATTIVALLLAISTIAAGDVEEATSTKQTINEAHGEPVSEPTVKLVHVLNPGEREYLSPNLIGVQNIAMTFLPLSMNFVNIIDAYREIVNGVRYEILLNAVDTKAKDADIICRQVILEKPWLTTQWGDKFRELVTSNCTDGAADNQLSDEKYVSNAIFNGGQRNELSDDEMAHLEAQIMPAGGPSKRRATTAPSTTTTTTKASTTITTTERVAINEPTTLISADEVAGTTPATADSDTNSDSNSKQANKELNDNEKQWLDDFLSVGAYNFEKSIEAATAVASLDAAAAVGSNNEEQQRESEPPQQQQQQLPLADANNYQTQVEEENVEKLKQPQAQQLRREERSLNDVPVGNSKPYDEKQAEEQLQHTLDKLTAGEGPHYKIVKVYSASRQVVSGTLTRIDADLTDAGGDQHRCIVEIWAQPWLEKGHDITFKCRNQPVVRARHSRSVEWAEKKTHKKHNHHALDKVDHLFHKFQIKFGRRYANTMERQMRMRIFRQNLKTIEELNANEMGSAKYGITEFADMTSTEYKERTGLWQRDEGKPTGGSPAVVPDYDGELPKDFDWRGKNAVTHVKNQGQCGSCWAFSAIGNIEGLYALKTGNLMEFSEQELLDCDTTDGACNGGLMDNAFKAIKSIGGLEYEDEYPYEAKKKQCHFNKTIAHVQVSGFVDLPKGNETAMQHWLVNNGPIAIAINANAMQFYRGGVSHPWKMLCSKKNLDHGVLVVGYGVSDYPNFKKTLPYWIVKNSWGPRWGEQGYYRVYRGDNTCGVSEMATSAVLA